MALEITKKRLEMMQTLTSKKEQLEMKELLDDNGQVAGTKVMLNLPIQFVSKK